MDLLTPEHVLLDSQAKSKRALITELAKSLTSMDTNQIMELVMAREQLGSTGIGHGVAIPHGRMPGLRHPVIAMARHRRGIEFDAIDGHPVHIVVMLLVPDDNNKLHLELLAHLARVMQQQQWRESIMQAETAPDIVRLFPDAVKKA